VAILTIHKSKGLEFPVVFAPYLWDGRRGKDGGGALIAPSLTDSAKRVLDVQDALDRLDLVQKSQRENFNIGNLIFAVFLLIFVVAGCFPLGIGLAIMFGRCRVEWRDGQLLSTELVGPLRWTRRMPRKPIRTLEVSTATSRSDNQPPKAVDNFSGITVLFADGSRKALIFGYPKDWALAVAQELRSYAGSGLASGGPLRVEVVESLLPRTPAEDVPQRPAGSSVQFEQRGAGIRLIVPPRGIWKGSLGMFFFSLLWNGFMAVFTVIFFLPGTKKEVSLGMFLLIIGGFWLVGIGMLLGAVSMGRRRAELKVDANRLSIRTEGVFGAKQRVWSRRLQFPPEPHLAQSPPALLPQRILTHSYCEPETSLLEKVGR